MQLAVKLKQFWKGTGWLLFFFKFFLFSIIAYLIWSNIHPYYGKVLSESVIAIQRRYIPVRDVRYTDQHGITVEVLMRPALHAVVPLAEVKPVSARIHLNTLYFNTIPFLALLLATPFRSFKRLMIFLLVGFILLSASHILHMSLNIQSYYYSSQTWQINRNNPQHQQFLYRIRLISRSQGFMEQAGSMIMPFFIWMFYSQNWLFKKLRLNQQRVTDGKQPSSRQKTQ